MEADLFELAGTSRGFIYNLDAPAAEDAFRYAINWLPKRLQKKNLTDRTEYLYAFDRW